MHYLWAMYVRTKARDDALEMHNTVKCALAYQDVYEKFIQDNG